MLTFARHHLTYANVLATLALFVALGGTATAAKAAIDGRSIKRGTVGATQLAANSITSAKVRNGSLLAADFAKGQLPAGVRGATGTAGATGAPGAAGSIGATGPQGTPGDRGAAGPAGAAGERGMTGIAGTPGEAGLPGAPGVIVRVPATGDPATDGAALVTAVAGITDASSAKPYVIYLYAAEYRTGTTPLLLPDYVSIVGVSTRLTRINGTTSAANDPVVRMGRASSLSHLVVRNANDSVQGTSTRIVSLGASGYGVLDDVEVFVAGAVNGSTILLDQANSELRVYRSLLTARGVSSENAAAKASGTALTIDDSRLLNGYSVGVDGGTVTVTNSRLEATNAAIALATAGAIRISYSLTSTIGKAGLAGSIDCVYNADLTTFLPRASLTTC